MFEIIQKLMCKKRKPFWSLALPTKQIDYILDDDHDKKNLHKNFSHIYSIAAEKFKFPPFRFEWTNG